MQVIAFDMEHAAQRAVFFGDAELAPFVLGVMPGRIGGGETLRGLDRLPTIAATWPGRGLSFALRLGSA